MFCCDARAVLCALLIGYPANAVHQTLLAIAGLLQEHHLSWNQHDAGEISRVRRALVTNPQDPYWNNPFSLRSAGSRPVRRSPQEQPPVFIATARRRRTAAPVNTFATLSLVFAFVFAPVGALLGHLGLAQIRRTGELGRDRALMGVALSYVFIALTVVALVGWATLRRPDVPHRSRAPATGTSEHRCQPTVAPDASATLLARSGRPQKHHQ